MIILLSKKKKKKELGNNIYIYPVHIESIKSNSIDLHISKFAWSLNTKKRIGDDEYIIIPAHDTALIYTEESIYVSRNIGGSYHSKVTLVSQGAGHIGTALDAQYIGCSIIAIHNHSNKELKWEIGSEFVTLQFWYLNSPDYEDATSHDNEPGHPRMLNGFDDVKTYIEWRDKNTWTTRKKDLYNKMIASAEYKQCKEEYQRELDTFNRGKVKGRIKRYLYIFVAAIVFALLLCIPSYVFEFGKISEIVKIISEKVIFPAIVTVITTFIIVDIKNNSNSVK